MTNWVDALPHRAVLVAAVGAGGRALVVGPGEVDTLVLAQPGWVRIGTPASAEARAAAAGHDTVSVSMQGVTGPWVLHRRRPPPCAGSGHADDCAMPSAQPRAATPPPPAVLGPTDLRSWLSRQLGGDADPGRSPGGVGGGSVSRLRRPGRREQRRRGAPTCGLAGRPRYGAHVLRSRALAAEDPELGAALSVEAGFTARALRQLPLRGWALGRRGFSPGAAVPGMWARDHPRWGRTRFPLGSSAHQALAAAVEEAFPRAGQVVDMADEAGPSHAGPAPATGDGATGAAPPSMKRPCDAPAPAEPAVPPPWPAGRVPIGAQHGGRRYRTPWRLARFGEGPCLLRRVGADL